MLFTYQLETRQNANESVEEQADTESGSTSDTITDNNVLPDFTGGDAIVLNRQPEAGVVGDKGEESACADSQTDNYGRVAKGSSAGPYYSNRGGHCSRGGTNTHTEDCSNQEGHNDDGHIPSVEDADKQVTDTGSLDNSSEGASGTQQEKDATIGVSSAVQEGHNGLVAEVFLEGLSQDPCTDEHGEEQSDLSIADKLEEGECSRLSSENNAGHDGAEEKHAYGNHQQADCKTGAGLGGIGSNQFFVADDGLCRCLVCSTLFIAHALVKEAGPDNATENACGERNDQGVEHEPTHVSTDTSSNGNGAGGGHNETVGNNQTNVSGAAVGAEALLGNLVKCICQRGEGDVASTEENGDRDEVASNVQSKQVVLLAELTDEALSHLFHCTGLLQDCTKAAAEENNQTDASHGGTEATGELAEHGGDGHAAEQTCKDCRCKQSNAAGDIVLHDEEHHEREGNDKYQ